MLNFKMQSVKLHSNKNKRKTKKGKEVPLRTRRKEFSDFKKLNNYKILFLHNLVKFLLNEKLYIDLLTIILDYYFSQCHDCTFSIVDHIVCEKCIQIHCPKFTRCIFLNCFSLGFSQCLFNQCETCFEGFYFCLYHQQNKNKNKNKNQIIQTSKKPNYICAHRCCQKCFRSCVDCLESQCPNCIALCLGCDQQICKNCQISYKDRKLPVCKLCSKYYKFFESLDKRIETGNNETEIFKNILQILKL